MLLLQYHIPYDPYNNPLNNNEWSFPLLEIIHIVGIAVAIGFVFVFLSMYTAVLERTREIGILKALGASPSFIVNILLRESLFLALLGAVTGIFFSYGTRYLFLAMIPASMQQKITPDWWPRVILIAILGALLGTIYPGLKAAKQDAIEALSYD